MGAIATPRFRAIASSQRIRVHVVGLTEASAKLRIEIIQAETQLVNAQSEAAQ